MVNCCLWSNWHFVFKGCVVNCSSVIKWSSMVNLSFCVQLIIFDQQNIFVVNLQSGQLTICGQLFVGNWTFCGQPTTCVKMIIYGQLIICDQLINDHLWSTKRKPILRTHWNEGKIIDKSVQENIIFIDTIWHKILHDSLL